MKNATWNEERRTALLAAPMPGSSWETMMRAPAAALAGEACEIEPEDLSGNLVVQLGGGDRGPEPALV